MDVFLGIVVCWPIMAAIGLAIDRKGARQFHKDRRRAKEIIRTLPVEQIVDSPHILSQPGVPELIRSLLTEQEIRDISARPPIDEVVLLPEMRPDVNDPDS